MKPILTLIILLLGLSSHAQNNDWTKYSEADGVVMYTKVSDCIVPSKGTEKQYILVKIKNENTFPVSISFNKLADYGSGLPAAGAENLVKIQLDANTEKEANCADSSKELKVFVKMLQLEDVRSLINYQLTNFSIETL